MSTTKFVTGKSSGGDATQVGDDDDALSVDEGKINSLPSLVAPKKRTGGRENDKENFNKG